MQDQIQEILRREELTSSQFADKIGVQRSSVSHVLSGRNKPGFDFIHKILEAFPAISAEWLITGYGDMYKQRRSSGGLFEGPFSETSPAPDEEKLSPRIESAGIGSPPKQAEKKQVEGEARGSEKEVEIEVEKEVEKVIVFYSDKTFREYRSE